MEYKPLNAARNEIRILNADPERLVDPETGMVRLSLENVSLDDYAQQSRDYMSSKGLTRIKKGDIFDMVETLNRAASLLTLSDFAALAESLSGASYSGNSIQRQTEASGPGGLPKEVQDMVDCLYQCPWQRFTWGDYSALSYAWGSS